MAAIFAPKKDLAKAVTVARAAAPEKPIKPEDALALVEVFGTVMTISTYDEERSIWTDVIVNGPASFVKRFLIDPVQLDRILKKCDASVVEIEIPEDDSNRIAVFAKEGRKASVTIEIFPVGRKVLKQREPLTDTVVIKRKSLVDALSFCQLFLAKLKDDMRRFDYITIDNAVAFASNGSSKRGYVVDRRLASIKGLSIHKANTVQTTKILSSWDTEEVSIQLTDRSLLISADMGDISALYSVDRSASEPIPIKDEYLNPKGPHSQVNFKELSRALDRVVLTDDTSVNEHIGLFLETSVPDADGNSELKTILADDSNGSYDSVSVVRVDDQGDVVRKVVDAKMVKDMLKSFTCTSNSRIYANDNNKGYFKLMASEDIDDTRRFEVAVGVYASLPGRR